MNQSFVLSSIVAIFLVVCVLVESLVITGFKIARFSRALWHAALVNTVSLLVVYFIWPFISRMDIDEDKVFPLLPILFFTTLLTEALLLKLLNRPQPWWRILLASVVMNGVSFAVLYSILLLL